MPATTPDLTATEAAAKYPRLSRRSLQNAALLGKIPARKVGRTYLLDGQAVALYAAVQDARHEFDQYVAANPGDRVAS